jgi:putative pyruvate formate lyase activating enzyme
MAKIMADDIQWDLAVSTLKAPIQRRRQLDGRLGPEAIAARISRIDAVLPELRERLDPCRLCPRQCGARRWRGKIGECGLDAQLRVASIARHKGEEPPISGSNDAINVFFSGCNLHCLHCQNWPISQKHVGRIRAAEELAEAILRKWRRGAHSLGWVTPTPQIVPALEAYRRCLLQGLDLPLVHNGGGYESVEIIRLLAGVVDLWLPDAKTGSCQRGQIINGVLDYPARNLEAIGEMVSQVKAGAARAVIVRHLPLPDGREDSRQILKQLWEQFGNSIRLSLMRQYFPTFRTEGHPTLGRRLARGEYESIVEYSRELGFIKGWIQCHEEEDGISVHSL